MMDYSGILPRLFVGSNPRTAEDIRELNQLDGITAILNLQTDDDLEYLQIDVGDLQSCARELDIDYRRVPVRDFDEEDLCDKLPQCAAVLAQLMDQGHKVLVHCSAGAGRSPSVVVAYLHRSLRFDLETADRYVQARRPCSPGIDAIRDATWDSE